jgi:UDP-N-acetylglucosamine 1-carboxyvinyltransferase
MGATVEIGVEQVTIDVHRRLHARDVTALPHPGLPTDVQPLLTAILTVARGRSHIQDRVFPERFTHLGALGRLGARVSRSTRGALVCGVPGLVGNVVRARDLRGGAALVLAGLAAEGETVLENVHYVERGYEFLAEKLSTLGARIERISMATQGRGAASSPARGAKMNDRVPRSSLASACGEF